MWIACPGMTFRLSGRGLALAGQRAHRIIETGEGKREHAVVHELAHAFALPHDVRQGQCDIMGHGFRRFRVNYLGRFHEQPPMCFSVDNARFLAQSRFLCNDVDATDDTPPVATTTAPNKIAKDAKTISIKVKATDEEIAYLCASVSEYLAKPVKPEDVVWTYAGVRPLYDDGASEAKAATREYAFELDTPGGAPLLSIYGGKITTYRRLAEEALEKLSPYLKGSKAREGWTAKAALPGGDMDVSAVAALTAELLRDYPFLAPVHANRLAHAYGTRAAKTLGTAKSADDLGRNFGGTLTESEVRYLIANEWACTAEDIVWRRSKLGLRMSAAEVAALDEWLTAQRPQAGRSPVEAGARL